jgi:hypothetical protein
VPAPRAKYYPLGGGLDLVSPSLTVNPGRLLACVNFEPDFNDGYRRVDGYERFDGRPRPHLQGYQGFQISDASGLSAGDAIEGATSGATGTVAVAYEDDGTYGFDWLAVVSVTGTFQEGESLVSPSVTIANTPIDNAAPSVALANEWLLAAQDRFRDAIGTVEGTNTRTGNVVGVVRQKAKTYALAKQNTGSSIFKATAAGWDDGAVTRLHTIRFEAGGGGAARDLPAPGDTLVGASSGAEGTVKYVTEWAGGTATNDATGYIVFELTSGLFSSNEDLEVSSTVRATAVGDASQFALGNSVTDCRFVNHNFFALEGTFRSYGVQDAWLPFVIDENDQAHYILMPTVDDLPADANPPPAAADRPFLIEEHKNHLFLAFPGGRIAHSVQGEPLNFSGFLDAAEFGLGSEITGMESVAGGVLVITTERDTYGLFGDNITNWELRLIGEGVGARLRSVQSVDTVYSLGGLGINSLARVETFGDFAATVVSQTVQPLINNSRLLLNDSGVVRRTNQYRLYFSDNTCLIMFVPDTGSANESRGTATSRRVQYGLATYPLEIKKVWNYEDENGEERIFFASTDGYVYEDQVGRNFDGAEIEAYFRTVFAHLGSPSYRKRFRRLDMEIAAESNIDLIVQTDYDYGEADAATLVLGTEAQGGGGFFDAANWDEFVFDGQSIATGRVQMTGSGENVSFLIYSSTAYAAPFTIQGFTLHHEVRRLRR